jgi:O-antigen ligase
MQSRNSSLERYLAISFPAIIVLGFLGRALFNIDFFISLLLFIFIIDKERIAAIARHDLIKGWTIFMLFVAFSNLFAQFFIFSWIKFLKLLFYSYSALFMGLYLYSYSERRRENILVAIRVFFISIVIMEAITIFNVISGFDILKYLSKGVKVPQAGNYHLREVFSVMIFVILLFWNYLRPKIYNYFFLAIAFLGILASTSRTAYVSVVTSLIVFFAVKNRKLFNKELITIALLGFVVLGSAYYFSPEIRQRVDTFKTIIKERNIGPREAVYKESVERISQHPIVGYGIKSGVKIYEQGDKLGDAKHPHNIYLEVLLDSGIIGFTGFIAFLYYLVRSFRGTVHKHVVAATFTAIFLSSLVSWSIWSVNHVSYVFVVITLLLGLKDFDFSKSLES